MLPNIVNTIQHCEAICEICGAECAKYPDAESQNCSRVCLNCAKECKEFSMKYSY